nr:dihydrolipoamide acetyltransferase family protein [Hyphomonas sp. Mor2]
MGEFVIKLPDIGEGVAEAELVEWLVEEGQAVREDDPLAAVMTDKATVEIPSPVEGSIQWLGPAIGDVVAVGSPIIKLEISGEGNIEPGTELSVEKASEEGKADSVEIAEPPSEPVTKTAKAPELSVDKIQHPVSKSNIPGLPRQPGEKPIAPPAVRAKAVAAGIDLRRVAGTGPAGRITHEDLAQFIASGGATVGAGAVRMANTDVKDIRVVGLRRVISEKISAAKSKIPHFSYIEEVDVTALEELRSQLNRDRREDQTKLTLLPFLMRAMVKAIAEIPQMNSVFDDDAGIVHEYGGVHIGIATQTDTGLVVPVVRHAEALSIWQCASEVSRVSSAARDGSAKRDELSGSSITITSLGALGGVATTPVINRPEVSIIGVNKMRVAPVWDGTEFRPRKIMNLSSSFDHRIIDGWDAALFIQKIKLLLENPAMIFVED